MKSIFCTVATTQKAEALLNLLKTRGISTDDISVLFADREKTDQFVYEKNTKAPEGAVAGASTGGVIGGILGWLVGIGSLAIPGVGPFIAAGPIMAALSGTAIGATVGGLIGTLAGLGIPEIEAKNYEQKLKEGEILVSVRTQNAETAEKVCDIFREAGVTQISETEQDVESTKVVGRSSGERNLHA